MDSYSKLWHDLMMKKTMHLFKNHRYSPAIIQYAVWLYFVFPLSFWDVELLLNQRGIRVSHEAIRSWCYKAFAD
jgi:putative transposase